MDVRRNQDLLRHIVWAEPLQEAVGVWDAGRTLHSPASQEQTFVLSERELQERGLNAARTASDL